MCGRVGERVVNEETPSAGLPHEKPRATRLASDSQHHRRSVWGYDIIVGARQRMNEGGQHRGEHLGIGEQRPSYRQTDLLLVVPSLRVLPGNVKPHRLRPWTSPAHGGPERGQIE